jgi:hypothetical protein
MYQTTQITETQKVHVVKQVDKLKEEGLIEESNSFTLE